MLAENGWGINLVHVRGRLPGTGLEIDFGSASAAGPLPAGSLKRPAPSRQPLVSSKKGCTAGRRLASSTAKRRKRLFFNCLKSPEAPIQRCGRAICCSAPEQGGKWIYQPLYCWPKLAL